MTSSYVSYTFASDSPANKGICQTEAEKLKDYLNNSISTDHTWFFYDFGDCGIPTTNYGDGGAEEKEFIRDVLNKFDRDDILTDWENIIIAHSKAAWGYGRSLYHETAEDNIPAYGCTVYAGDLYIADWETKQATWHEGAHSYNGYHWRGKYYLDIDGEVDNIRPMGTFYTINDSGENDANWYVTDGPDNFCDHKNREYPFDSNSSLKELHYFRTLSSCTRENVKKWANGNRP